MPNEERDWLGARKVSLPWSWLLALYLVLVVGIAAWMLIEVFPSPPHEQQKTAHKDELKGKGNGGAPPRLSEPTPSDAHSPASAGNAGQGPAVGGAGGAALGGTAGANSARAGNGGTTVAEKPTVEEDQDRPSWPTNLKYGTFAHLGMRIEPKATIKGSSSW